MNRAATGLLFVLALALLGQTIKTITAYKGLPNFFPIVRDLLLMTIFVWSLGRASLFSNTRLAASLILFLFLFIAYIVISILENQYFIGFYYARVYLQPILFFVAMNIILQQMNFTGVVRVLRFAAWFNVFILLAAFVLYAMILYLPGERVVLFGASILPSAWYISGGIFMRMGLPLTAPNSLGTYLGLSLLMTLLVILAMPSGTRGRRAYMLLAGFNIIALVATFSRSAMLMVVVGSVSLLLVPAFRRGRFLSRLVTMSAVFLVVVVMGGMLVELLSNGFVSRWIELNLSLQDPSMRGHMLSFETAYNNFYQYALYGYDRGTVGPKALVSISYSNNIENSVLGVIYDFGIIGAFFFFLGYALLFVDGYKTKLQLPLLVGFLVNIQFLPYIFEPEIISFFIFAFLLIGHLDRVGFFSSLYEVSDNQAACMPKKGFSGNVKQSGLGV